MNKPFNDEPVEQLIPKLLSEDGKSLDLRLKYIGDDGLKIVAGTESLRGLEVLNLEAERYHSGGNQSFGGFPGDHRVDGAPPGKERCWR